MIAKLALTLIGLIALALGLTVLLDHVKFERAFSELVESRFVFVMEELKSTIETGLDLGLSLANMKNMESVIERELQRDDHILSITLFDQERILIHAGKDRFEENRLEAGALWRRTLATPVAGYWHDETPTARQVGARLSDNSGQQTGGIVLQYDRTLYDRDISQMLADLARSAATLGLATAPLVFASLFCLFHRIRSSLARIRSALDKPLPDLGATGFRPRPDAAFELHYAAAEQKTREVLATLASEQIKLKSAGAERGPSA